MPNKVKVTYTENEQAAIEVLKANVGEKLSAADLGIKPVILTSLVKKFAKSPEIAFPIYREDFEDICPNCGAKRNYKLYWTI